MITILTCTYNRKNTLPRLYKSIKAQSLRNFEWIVIDDGSTDGTSSFLDSLRGDVDFPFHSFYKENGGKHSALNRGVAEAKGDWIFVVDSDDALSVDAIETLELRLLQHAGESLAGLAFRKSLFNGDLIGVLPIGVDVRRMSPTRAGAELKGDLAYVFRREFMTSCPFPIIPGEKFVPELYVWNKISELGEMVFYMQKVIYFAEYLDDGYSKRFKNTLMENPAGFVLYYSDQIWRENSILRKLKCFIRLIQALYYVRRKCVG